MTEHLTDYYHEWLAQGKEIARLQAHNRQLLDQIAALVQELNTLKSRPTITKEYLG